MIVNPNCEVPSRPYLPTLTSNELRLLNDYIYWTLEDRERRLVDWALEMEATLETLCTTRQP